MSNSKVQVYIGDTLEEVGARAIDTWRRMEHGEEVNQKHISFEDWKTMSLSRRHTML